MSSSGRSTTSSVQRAYLGAPYQLVATRNANPGAYASSGTTNTNFISRIKHIAAVECSQVRLIFVNWNAAETANTNAIPIKASVESAGGTIIPVYFQGVRTGNVDPGAVLVSDPVGIDLAQGDTFWTRTFVLVTAGQSVPYTIGANSADGEGGGAGTADTSAKVDSGTVTAASSAVYGPFAILAAVKSTVPSVMLIGDSIIQGTGDTMVKNDWGFAARALSAVNIATARVARGGELVQTYAALATGYKRRQVAAIAKYALCEYGVNDVFGSRTLAQVQADLLTTWFAASRVGQLVYQTTITPRTTSTDSWTTVTNQTTANSAQNTVRINLNAWIRAGAPIDPTTKAAVAVGTSGALLAGVSGHPLTGYFEVADVVESARDSGKFKAPGVTATGDTTSGSPTLANVSGFTTAHVGLLVVGAGIPTGTAILSVSGTTVTLSGNATATATGVALSTAHSSDGSHPSPAMHQLMAAAIDTTKFV